MIFAADQLDPDNSARCQPHLPTEDVDACDVVGGLAAASGSRLAAFRASEWGRQTPSPAPVWGHREAAASASSNGTALSAIHVRPDERKPCTVIGTPILRSNIAIDMLDSGPLRPDGEDERVLAALGLLSAQDRDGLLAERHPVPLRPLHPLGVDAPDRPFEVDLVERHVENF